MENNQVKILQKIKEMEGRAQLLESEAATLRKDCHKTRCLLEAGVSTPAKESKVNQSAVAKVIAKRKSFLNKKTRQVGTAGHL
jgi:hypothetical protein